MKINNGWQLITDGDLAFFGGLSAWEMKVWLFLNRYPSPFIIKNFSPTEVLNIYGIFDDSRTSVRRGFKGLEEKGFIQKYKDYYVFYPTPLEKDKEKEESQS